MNQKKPLETLLQVMARLRSPTGCPWDREQDHFSLRRHAIEEVYELIDAIEAKDDHELAEELGDLLLQVVFHCQLAQERGAFDFEKVTQLIADKLIRRHPHVFGDTKVKNVAEVWANWEKIKRGEKEGTQRERKSAFDGIPRHLPALLRAEKLSKQAHKTGLVPPASQTKRKISPTSPARSTPPSSRTALAAQLFELARLAQARGWCAEELLAGEAKKRERAWRRLESSALKKPK